MVSPDMRKSSASDRREAISFLQFAGLRLIGWALWTFIPKGDMPRWTCVILEVWIAWAASAGWAHVAGPHSYRHQRRLTTLSISHWCTFAMADARLAVRQKKMLRGGVEC